MTSLITRARKLLKFDRNKDVSFDSENDLIYTYDTRIAKLVECLLECAKALAFYADERNHGLNQSMFKKSDVQKDFGQTADKALDLLLEKIERMERE